MKLSTIIPLSALLCCKVTGAVLTKDSSYLRSAVSNPASFNDVADGSTIAAPKTVSSTSETLGLHKSRYIGIGGVQIYVKHAQRVPSEQYKYQPVDSDCFVGSYNIGHDKLGFKMLSMNITSEVDTDAQTDSDANTTYLDQYLWGNMHYIDTNPPRDYSALPLATRFYAWAESPSAGQLHKEFVDTFCNCLRDSGTVTYANITNCTITYLVSHTNHA